MKLPPESIAEVNRWIDKAENDLRNAEHVLKMPENCPTDTVCFHAQQCAEKYFKALLVFRENPFPKTHDLIILLNLLVGESGIGLQAPDVHSLNRYSVEARYPGDWDPIDMDEAKEAVVTARKVRKAVRSVLPGEVLSNKL